MALTSSHTYTTTTSTNDLPFNITFSYLRDTHVIVQVGSAQYDIDDNFFTINTTSTAKVVLNTAVASGTVVKVLRKSLGKNNDQPFLVDFNDGSVLTEKEQDESYQHNYYLNQETHEGNLTVETPLLDSDAANKGYVDGEIADMVLASGTGTVTNVTAGNGLSGGTITSTGTVSIPTSGGTINVDSSKAGIGIDPDTDYALKVAAKMCVYGSGSDGTELRVEDPTATSKVYLKGATGAVLDLQDSGTTSGSQQFRIQSNNGNLKFLQLNDNASSTTNTLMQLKAGGKVTLDSLPTSDPSVTGELWNDGGVVSVSGSSGFSGGGSGSTSFGARALKSYNTVYYSSADAIVTAEHTYVSSWPNMIAYADTSNPPTTERLGHNSNDDGGGQVAMTFIVKAGEYWKVTIDGSYTDQEIVYTPMS